jgi:hypothetical protein
LTGATTLDGATVEIFDMVGRLVLRTDLSGDPANLDIDRLAPGTYIVQRIQPKGLAARTILTVF